MNMPNNIIGITIPSKAEEYNDAKKRNTINSTKQIPK